MNAVTNPQQGNVVTLAPEPAALLEVISRAAENPNVDVDKMQKLLDMQERILAKRAESDFNEAMNHAQSEMGRIAADKENSQTNSRYASYAALDRVLRPIYTKHGFSISFDTAEAAEGFVKVLAYVSHRGGHTRTYSARVPSDGKGAKGGAVMTGTHAFGAANAYGMRYLQKLIWNVAIGEDDTDGNLPADQGGFDDTDWRTKIWDCKTMADLTEVGNELAQAKGIPPKVMIGLRNYWSQKARSLS